MGGEVATTRSQGASWTVMVKADEALRGMSECVNKTQWEKVDMTYRLGWRLRPMGDHHCRISGASTDDTNMGCRMYGALGA